MTDEPVLTIGDIHRRLPSHRLHQIQYAIREYAIEPRRRVGIVRLWAEADVATIAAALRRIAERREVCRG